MKSPGTFRNLANAGMVLIALAMPLSSFASPSKASGPEVDKERTIARYLTVQQQLLDAYFSGGNQRTFINELRRATVQMRAMGLSETDLREVPSDDLVKTFNETLSANVMTSEKIALGAACVAGPIVLTIKGLKACEKAMTSDADTVKLSNESTEPSVIFETDEG